MADDLVSVSLDGFTPPGTIRVTEAALELAKKFQASIPAGWIVVFRWYDGRRERASKEAPWVDMGPGLDLGTFQTGDIPEKAFYHAGSFRYAVLIRADIVESHPLKTIDLMGSGRLALQ